MDPTRWISDLLAFLREQVAALRASSASRDAGQEWEARHRAQTIRIPNYRGGRGIKLGRLTSPCVRALTGGNSASFAHVTIPCVTDEEIEAELARLALEGSGRGLQPKVAALRAILKNRQVKRARGGVHEDAETVGVFAELDLLPDMARAAGMAIGPDEWNAGMSLRVRGLERDGRAILKAPDRAVALAEWRKRQSAA